MFYLHFCLRLHLLFMPVSGIAFHSKPCVAIKVVVCSHYAWMHTHSLVVPFIKESSSTEVHKQCKCHTESWYRKCIFWWLMLTRDSILCSGIEEKALSSSCLASHILRDIEYWARLLGPSSDSLTFFCQCSSFLCKWHEFWSIFTIGDYLTADCSWFFSRRRRGEGRVSSGTHQCLSGSC